MFRPRHGTAVFVLIFLALLVFVYATADTENFSGKVVAVTDGDTIKVMHDGKAEKVRLGGIDCPEKKQAFLARGWTAEILKSPRSSTISLSGRS